MSQCVAEHRTELYHAAGSFGPDRSEQGSQRVIDQETVESIVPLDFIGAVALGVVATDQRPSRFIARVLVGAMKQVSVEEKAIPGFQVRVVDEDFNDTKPGEIGQMIVKGPNGCRYLDDMDRQLLVALIDKFGGRPVGIETIAASLREDKDTIEDVYEPFLLRLGMIERTQRGRVATRAAYEHLGYKVPKALF